MLPPEKKARLMETKTEQHHEHLTEEEKKISAQIRSVAATLYEKSDLNKPTVEFLCEQFYKDPTLALTYLLLFNRSLCGNIQISRVGPYFKLDRESHWTRRSNALPRDISQT